MTAPAPYYINANLASTSAANLIGGAVGDLMIVVQWGTASGAAVPSPPVWAGGGSTGWQNGSDTSGSDLYVNDGTAGHGRVQIWSVPIDNTNIGLGATFNGQGFSVVHYMQVMLPGPFTAGRVYQTIGSHANTGSTPFSLNNPPRAATVITAIGESTNVTGVTITWDGATSGTNFQRTPYANGNSGATTTTGGHSNHYGSGVNECWADYNEYDAADTPSSVLWNNGMGNSTHATAIITYQTANTVAINAASTVETAQPIGKTKTTAAIGVAATVETAQSIGHHQGGGILVGLVSEVESAQIVTPSHRKTLGVAATVEAAQTIHHAHSEAAHTANEVEAAQAIAPLKFWADEVTISDPTAAQSITSIQLTASKNYPNDAGDIQIGLKQGGTLLQTTSYTALTGTPTVISMTLSSPPSGTGFSVWWQVRTSTQLDPIISGVEAFVVTHVGTASVVEMAQPILGKGDHLVHIAPEVETAQAIGSRKAKALGVAIETDLAQAIGIVQTVTQADFSFTPGQLATHHSGGGIATHFTAGGIGNP